MQIDIQTQKFSLTNALQSYAKRRLNFALANKSEYINRVIMRLSDINGPRGGTDKRCRLQVRLSGLPDVFVEDIETDMYTSIDRACDRISRTVTRKINRKQTLLRYTRHIILNKEFLDEEILGDEELILAH